MFGGGVGKRKGMVRMERKGGRQKGETGRKGEK